MKIFLDTADRKAIKTWLAMGIIDGITTNPSHLSKEGGDPTKVVQDICQMLGDRDVSVEITEIEPQKVYEQALKIADIAENVIVKVPCHENYYEVIKRLVKEGVKINVTLVFTLVQGMFMCKLGVRYISPFIGRWDDIDVEGIDLLYEMRTMVDQYEFDTQILAASIRHVRHLHDAIMAGVDVVTVPLDVLEKSVNHPLTDRGMEKFLADWQKLGIKQFP
ncbi:MAG: transaldolase family protein [Candidatus Babeliales bacterium]